MWPLGASTDLTHVVFLSAAQENNVESRARVREWFGGRVVQIGVSNKGEVWEAYVGSTPNALGKITYPKAGRFWRAVSADGTRVVFNHEDELYMRVNGEQEQSKMSGEECLEPAKACTIKLSAGTREYWGASTDDSKVFYIETEDLYEYTLPLGSVKGEAKALTTGGKVQGVVQISEDGPYCIV